MVFFFSPPPPTSCLHRLPPPLPLPLPPRQLAQPAFAPTFISLFFFSSPPSLFIISGFCTRCRLRRLSCRRCRRYGCLAKLQLFFPAVFKSQPAAVTADGFRFVTAATSTKQACKLAVSCVAGFQKLSRALRSPTSSSFALRVHCLGGFGGSFFPESNLLGFIVCFFSKSSLRAPPVVVLSFFPASPSLSLSCPSSLSSFYCCPSRSSLPLFLSSSLPLFVVRYSFFVLRSSFFVLRSSSFSSSILILILILILLILFLLLLPLHPSSSITPFSSSSSPSLSFPFIKTPPVASSFRS